jgi:hypothetical protein
MGADREILKSLAALALVSVAIRSGVLPRISATKAAMCGRKQGSLRPLFPFIARGRLRGKR